MNPFSQTVVSAPGVPRTLQPRLFKSTIELATAIDGLLSRSASSALGIAVLLDADEGLLEAVAFATIDNIFVLYPRTGASRRASKNTSAGADDFASLLYGQKAVLVGFGMARLAFHIRHGLNVHVRGIELAEAAITAKDKNASPGVFVRNYVDFNANIFAVDILWDAFPADLKDDPARLEHLCLRAWLSARIAAHPDISREIGACSLADTVWLSSKYFKPIYQMLVEVEQMEAAKPRIQENDFSSVERDADGKLIINNERYKNRVRASDRTAVVMVDEDDQWHVGHATQTNGKQTHVTTLKNTGTRVIKHIRVVGKEELGNAERARETLLLHLLQGKCVLHDPAYELIQKLYFPIVGDVPPAKIVGASRYGKLNQSQADVVEAMVESDAPFVIVHGPPGTGKTSTISSAVQEWVLMRSPVWVVAQSNVGVKNIAEKLCKDNVEFKLLVSKEFHFEWHEHIYDEQVGRSLIRTDELPAHPPETAVLFHGVYVVLCTISTLSNPSLEHKNIFSFVPMTNLVVDEASQIGIFNYMHVFARFKRLDKVCFFGDPKQLPPFGQDSAPTLQSIFDVRHLKPQAYFLNTQYRMPVPLGTFISSAVYNDKLRSEHKEKSPSCVAFVDASLGKEEERGKSYMNLREVQTIIHLVQYYYQRKDYCIITPYDAQRSEIQNTLKSEGLRWDNVYNVDSFQGNEANFIIVSVVRTSSPGFLSSQNRVNVMLTRCKEGMVIVTNRNFMQQRNVKETLLGQLHQHWVQLHGREGTWRDWKAVAEEKADLPGALGRRRVESLVSLAAVAAQSAIGHLSLPHLLTSRTGSYQSWSPAILDGESTRKPAPLPFPSALPPSPSRSSQGSTPPATASDDLRSVTSGLQRTHLNTASIPNYRTGSSSAASAYVGSRAIGSVQPALSSNPHDTYYSSFPDLPSDSSPRLQAVRTGAWSKGPPTHVSQKHANHSADLGVLPSQKVSVLAENMRPSTMSQKKSGKWESLALF